MPLFQRITFSNARQKTLCGHYYPSTGKACVILSHGLLTDKFSDGRFTQMAEALHSVGCGVLQFDYAGCGESEADSLSSAKQIDDLNSAIRFMQAQGFENIGLYGHSAGTLIYLKAANPAVQTMVLAGAVTGPSGLWLGRLNQRHRTILEEKGGHHGTTPRNEATGDH